MTVDLADLLRRFSRLSWLTGPIFDKELRVSSRRRRNYVLRFAYLVLLTIFLALFWLEQVRYRGSSSLWIASRMAVVGKGMVMFIVWFQFCATQIIAVVMLSTSISDEIYNRTLGLLMTTPINSFQIVMGKLFSKLLQLILLLAISLPLLAIVRVFGGVPWDYVISSLCITLTAAIFVGSLSLFFSIFSRRTYVVIIITTLVLAAIFALLPILAAMLLHNVVSDREFFSVLCCLNPYVLLALNSTMMMSPRVGSWIPLLSWPANCGIVLAGSSVVLLVSMVLVRRVALLQATGQLGKSSRRRLSETGPLAGQQHFTSVPKRVKGSAVLWKELKSPVLGRHKIATFVAISIGVALVLMTYGLCEREHILDEEAIHMLYAAIFMGLGMLFTIILPATCITSEKEARSWPLLLSTTLSDWQIILGKFIGALRRCAPIWLFLFGHVILFTWLHIIHPIAIIQMAILVAWLAVFLSSTGLYFSARFKRTTTAVIMNFALAGVIWALAPLLMFLILNAADLSEDLAELYINGNPVFQGLVVMSATANGWTSLRNYHWCEFRFDAVESTFFMLAFMLCYMLVSLLFICRTKARLRRGVF